MEKGKCITDLTHMVIDTIRTQIKTSKLFTKENCSTGSNQTLDLKKKKKKTTLVSFASWNNLYILISPMVPEVVVIQILKNQKAGLLYKNTTI